MQSQGGQAAHQNIAPQAPFNVTGINPAASKDPNATLAIGGVKKVWGAQSIAEEVKNTPDQSSSGPSLAKVSNPTFGPGSQAQSAPDAGAPSKNKAPENKADKKK